MLGVTQHRYMLILPNVEPVAPKFLDWINRTGQARIARDLDVSRHTVAAWARWARGDARSKTSSTVYRPSPGRIEAIVRLAAGALTAVDIYPEFGATAGIEIHRGNV